MFNSKHIDWGYQINDTDGEFISNWMGKNGLELIYDAKEIKSFHSAVWNTDIRFPDLCFVSEKSSS